MIATILAVLVILFMILLIFILYPISFSPTSYIVFPNEGFSTQWYEKLFSDPLWAQAVQNSIVIAIFTTILSLLLGTIAAVCMNRFSHKWKTVLGEYFRLPQTIPIIVTAISIYALLLKWQLNGTLPGLVIAHTVIALPFVVTTMNAGMEIINNNFEDAAVNLGANRFMAFFHVTLPMLKSSIQSAMLFAFLTSFDEIAVTLFITGPSVITIPKKMWDGIRLQIEPTIAALSVILVSVLIVGFVLTTLGQMIKAARHHHAK